VAHAGGAYHYLFAPYDIEGNKNEDRQLSDHLYVSHQEIRIQQEVVLGIGGVRVLRALGLQPSIWHANEGHTAFMMLERIRELVAAGIPFAEARERVRANTVFTTHTPVPAATTCSRYTWRKSTSIATRNPWVSTRQNFSTWDGRMAVSI